VGGKELVSKKLFFSPEIRMEFEWKGHLLRGGSVRPHNKQQISDGLRDMSPETIRNRFLGSKREFSDKELQYLTNLDGWNHYAFGLEENSPLPRGLAIIRLVRASHCEKEAEVAITIIDRYQKMGLGTFLMNIIILAALEREIETLSFSFLPQNTAIEKLISRLGVPLPGAHTKDYVQLYLNIKDMDIEEVKSGLVKILPEIGNFHLET
jgi:GNAT superfamily N-acetyltransferase